MMTWFWVLSTSERPRLIWVKPVGPTLLAALKLVVPPSGTDRGVPPASTGTSLVGVMARLTVRFTVVVPSLVEMVKSAAPLASARPRKFLPLMAALTSLRVPLKLTEPVPLPVRPISPVVLARVRVPVVELRVTVWLLPSPSARVMPLMAMLLSSLPLRVALMLSVMVGAASRPSSPLRARALASMEPDVASSMVSPPLPTEPVRSVEAATSAPVRAARRSMKAVP